jgi:hypothetical protein
MSKGLSLRSFVYLLISFSFLAFLTTACGSSALRQRKEVRDRAVMSTKMYCEFVNGDVYPNDLDVALNITVAKHCESGTPVSMTQYKTPSESNGIMFCCPVSSNLVSQLAHENGRSSARAEAKKADEAKKAEVKKETKPPVKAPPSMNDKDELDE